ncbi:hypothetical protein BECAL_00412 [Bellilinea caldifistulae]|uniref:Uncharacterized protein n=1 Tax=Bellilinea caldifistulae TaxID=360411 RepID=A0A0P6X811_9CHLR|nr:hypothetical protein [Bellilinea caldifistulae]KPL78167.1 hypothetical protein AC812_01745 [Bellilinea caldifistulae]GAP09271.1 hypothetical protein BECAL_00412 [Bellilinea caldifistulae]
MNQTEMWPVALGALQALAGHYRPAMGQIITQLNLPAGCTAVLFPAFSFDPEPVTAEKIHLRGAYTAVSLFSQRLREAAGLGLMEEVENAEGAYRLTPSGREAAAKIIQAAYECMSGLQPLPRSEMEQLAALLHRLVDACLKAPPPPEKWCIQLSRRLDGGEDAHPFIRIDQYLSDLAAYRDDAHLAAWRPLECSGQAWEAFTLVWRAEADTLEELCVKLERRGFSREEYRQALDDLIRRGWLQAEKERYLLTPLGGQIRQAAEERTDQYFYAPWQCLSTDEVDLLRSLLIRLRENLIGRGG